MPKAKPTQVIVHRIELQEKEREMAEAYFTTKAIQNIAWPVVGAATGLGAFYLYNEVHAQGQEFWRRAKETNIGKAIQAGLTTDFVKIFTG